MYRLYPNRTLNAKTKHYKDERNIFLVATFPYEQTESSMRITEYVNIRAYFSKTEFIYVGYVSSNLGTSFGWGKGGNVTSAGWQVTLCDPMRHVSSRSGVAILRIAILLLLTYLLTWWQPRTYFNNATKYQMTRSRCTRRG